MDNDDLYSPVPPVPVHHRTLTPQQKVLIVVIILFVLIGIGTGVGIYLVQREGEGTAVKPTIPPITTVVPIPERDIKSYLLKADDTNCYYLTRLNGTFALSACANQNGTWSLEHTGSQSVLSYNEQDVYGFCLQSPDGILDAVRGGYTLKQCDGINRSSDNKIIHPAHDEVPELCVQNNGGSMIWNTCDQGTVFTWVDF